MKYVVQASNVKELYEVKKFTRDESKTFYQKPEFEKTRVDDWQEVVSFECDRLEYNKGYRKNSILQLVFDGDAYRINISEKEEVRITGQIFRADKATTYLHSDKILSTTEDKGTNWRAYQVALQEYRDYVLKTYPAVKEYCELHCVKDELENIDKIKEIVLKEDKKYFDIGGSQLLSYTPVRSMFGGCTLTADSFAKDFKF